MAKCGERQGAKPVRVRVSSRDSETGEVRDRGKSTIWIFLPYGETFNGEKT